MRFKKEISLTLEASYKATLIIQQVFQLKDRLIVVAEFTPNPDQSEFPLSPASFKTITASVEVEFEAINLVIPPVKFYLVTSIDDDYVKSQCKKLHCSLVQDFKKTPAWNDPELAQIYSAEAQNQQEVILINGENERQLIIESLINFPEQLKSTSDLAHVMGLLLNVKQSDIAKSEILENSMIKFIYLICKDTLPFLTANVDVSDQAHYAMFEDRVCFMFKIFDQMELKKITEILNTKFPDLNASLYLEAQIQGKPWISLDKKMFIQEMLPAMFDLKLNLKEEKKEISKNKNTSVNNNSNLPHLNPIIAFFKKTFKSDPKKEMELKQKKI